MHGDRVVVRIARIEAGRPRRWRNRQGAEARAPHRGGRVPHRPPRPVRGAARRAHPAVDRDSRGHGDSAGRRRRSTASASTPPQVASVEELDGMIVNVELLEYPRRASPVGRVIEILGQPDDFGVDVEIVIRKHHLPHRFPPEVIEQAEAIPACDRRARAGRPPRFPRHRHRHHRRRNRARFRRRRVGGPAGQRQLRARTCTSPT